MKSSFHNLIPFLPLFCNCQFRRLESIQFLYYQNYILSGWRLKTRVYSITADSNNLLCPYITPHHGPRRKHSLSIVEKACSLIRCLAIDVLLLPAYACTGMCLSSHCLIMGLYITVCLFVQYDYSIYSYDDLALKCRYGRQEVVLMLFNVWIKTKKY
jgi:hypothetical protein